jgi:hypothetical protein
LPVRRISTYAKAAVDKEKAGSVSAPPAFDPPSLFNSHSLYEGYKAMAGKRLTKFGDVVFI